MTASAHVGKGMLWSSTNATSEPLAVAPLFVRRKVQIGSGHVARMEAQSRMRTAGGIRNDDFHAIRRGLLIQPVQYLLCSPPFVANKDNRAQSWNRIH